MSRLRGVARSSLTVAMMTVGIAGVKAQEPPSSARQEPQVTPLPPVTVEAQKEIPKKKAKAKSKPAKAVSAPKVPTAPQQSKSNSTQTETATGPVKGIVATRSATGTKTDTPLIETPQSVSVVTADRISQQAVTSLNQALAYTAGVMPAIWGLDTRFDWVSIRGFDAYQPGYFIDGLLARNNNTWAVAKVEPYAAERIEVLKGPPSVLYGQGNVGGMINVVSKRPLDEPFNEVQVRIGNNNRLETDFDFSGPATSDGKLLYRLTGVVVDTDTQMDFVDEKEMFIAPALTWKPEAGTTLTVLGQYRKDDTVPSPATYLPTPDSKVRPNLFVGEPDHDKFEREQWAVGYLFEHRLDSIWKVRQNLRYTSIDVDYKTVYGVGSSDNGATLNRVAFRSDETADLFTVDNHAEAKFVTGNVQHTLLAGIDYQRNWYSIRSGSGAASPLDLSNPVYGIDFDEPAISTDAGTVLGQTGLYLQEQAKIAERLIVTLGGRYDWARTELDDRSDNDADEEKTDKAFTWRGALLYRDPSGLAPYYSYSESFFPQSASGELFEPETGQQHEVGVKYEMPGIRSLFGVAAFDIKRQNYLTYDPGDNYAAKATGEIHSQGIEFEGAADPLPGLEVLATYTWIPTFDITKSSDPSELGQRSPMVPEHTASFWMHYQLQDGAFKGLGFGSGVRYIGDNPGYLGTVTAPDVTLFDAAIDYEINDWRFAVNATNLTDEYVISCYSSCYLGETRKVIASIRRRW
ncbi:TonB-dependent siderophore receptor [Hyphomicrobium sp. NDB2Meth4]|uniref:TonB-dependent siderophore receptor n=1 Tax=Hyphomicrobium sp. NDB2Meth4 TaxID=1892846 RepID=UPI0009F92D54|nr:TonB-dependent siderophore receptor [Hyphomicrobium sp. NDB2Meth4]